MPAPEPMSSTNHSIPEYPTGYDYTASILPQSTTLILTKLVVPTANYDVEPSKTIVINLTLHPRVVITCSTLSGAELGYFGWDSGAVDIAFEGDDEVVISYSTTPSIWSSGQRIPETREFLTERGWFHTFANVVTRVGVGDGGGIMRLSVKMLEDHKIAGGVGGVGVGGGVEVAEERNQGSYIGGGGNERLGIFAGDNYAIVTNDRGNIVTTPEMEDDGDEGMDDEYNNPDSSQFSPSRVPRTPGGKDKKRVVNGKIGKIGKVKGGAATAAGNGGAGGGGSGAGGAAMKKILNPFAKLTIK
ncbi:hypothetical protein ABW19_dt0207379 [Dactylella cylindrospora]|nr:hypothetical protein ABW19_dt0207379 [Dactylella cylindrospora]